MSEPSREDIDRMSGPVLLEFGAGWCPHCRVVRPAVDALLAHHPGVRHVAVEDGRGKPLGRSFRVKLWPTLVFLWDGVVVSRLVRPEAGEMSMAFEELAGGGA